MRSACQDTFWLRRTLTDCTPSELCKIEIQYKFHYKEYTLVPRPCMLTTCNGWMTGSQLTGLHMHLTALPCMSYEDAAASISDYKTHRNFWEERSRHSSEVSCFAVKGQITYQNGRHHQVS